MLERSVGICNCCTIRSVIQIVPVRFELQLYRLRLEIQDFGGKGLEQIVTHGKCGASRI